MWAAQARSRLRGRQFPALSPEVLGCVTRSTVLVNRIGAIKQNGRAPFTAFSSLSSQYRCCFLIRQFAMHSLGQVPGIEAVVKPRPVQPRSSHTIPSRHHAREPNRSNGTYRSELLGSKSEWKRNSAAQH
jgi:hypothetical protein